MSRRGPRKKYNYDFIIQDWELVDDFEEYCKNHGSIRSRKRLARSFLLNLGINYHLTCYELGCEMPFLVYVSSKVNSGDIVVSD